MSRTFAKPKDNTAIHIRWMIRRDMPEVLAIEEQCFEFPWPQEDFIRCLRQRNCIGMVVEHRERVVGYMIYELLKRSLNVLNLAVMPSEQRTGVGSKMIAKLIGKLTLQRRDRLDLTIRETNLGGQLFLRSCGFRATEVLRGQYEDSPEDAYLMRLKLIDILDGAN